MPLHKITGLLNNCALNRALPHLLDGISKLAELEARGTMDCLADNVIVQRYTQLKERYAVHYGIDHNLTFNWHAFHTFLSAHSFYANEIMFAPVFRRFIAEIGLASGDYPAENLPLLRDLQRNGRYNSLSDTEAADLFHNQFGISIQTYEYIENRETDNPQNNYHLVTTRETRNRVYPFLGDAPLVNLYLKNAHFEIQPHESLVDAIVEFIAETNKLPPALMVIHEGLSCSQSAYQSSVSLGSLVVYVHQSLTAQLTPATQPLLADVASSDDLQKVIDIDNAKEYLISAEEYAVLGREGFNDSAAGRQTLAVILLTILGGCGEKRAQKMLNHINRLALAAERNEPLASYLLDKLAVAIIESKANVDAPCVENTMKDIKLSHKANQGMRHIVRNYSDSGHVSLVREARRKIALVWQSYNETKDDAKIQVIQNMQAVAIKPNLQNVQKAKELHSQVKNTGHWGKFIAGLLLSVIGLAMIVIGSIGIGGSLGMGLPVGLPVFVTGIASLGAGIAFFDSSRDKDKPVDKEMRPDGVHATI